ncbi:MAG: hypothetical protein ACRCXT_21330 [Paraclostridium sp.]
MEKIQLRVKGFKGGIFIGKFGYNDDTTKVVTNGMSQNGNPWLRANFGITNASGMHFIESFGTKFNNMTIDAFINDKKETKKFENVPYDEVYGNVEAGVPQATYEREDGTKMTYVAGAKRKYRIKAGPYEEEVIDEKSGEVKKVIKYKHYIETLDIFTFTFNLCKIMKELKDKRVMISTDTPINTYNGSHDIKLSSLQITELHESQEYNDASTIELPAVLDPRSYTKLPTIEKLKSMSPGDRKFPLEILLPRWNKAIKDNELVPINTVIDLSTLDLDSELAAATLNVYDMMLTKTSEAKPLKKDKFYQGVFIFNMFNGRENKVEISTTERQLIAAGLTTEAQVLKEKGGYGERVREIRFVRLKSGEMLTEVAVDPEIHFYQEEVDTVVQKNSTPQGGFQL